jgi:hypothetical protein
MAIDRQKIIDEMSKIRVEGNEEGLIPALGVYVQQLPSDFWNEYSISMVLSEEGTILKEIEKMLTTAAHDCGYHTGHGIITSDEWNTIVGPMIEQVPEDILHGAYAVFAAWGWADAEIVDLVPGEKMVVRASSYYEADGARKAGVKHFFAYMIRGVCAGFMDLAYGRPYPGGRGTFECEQTKGIEIGDQYGEFVVTRKQV